MRFWINILKIKNNLKNLNYFEYTLGWFTFIHKDYAISVGKKGRFMVFLTLEDLFNVLQELETNPEKKYEIVLEDHGDVYTVLLKGNKIVFSIKNKRFIANFSEFKEALSQGTIKYFDKLKRLNSDIQKEEFYPHLYKLATTFYHQK